ncbi:MAG: 2-hydroxyacid dehydrogenase [Polaromonas sp.]|uniref:2-hydroxyacid dehydrogenase n=2 Tax=Polaromonas sp. TaxID=1869339 RepID=UPI00272F3C98|nr:2-hydroxyacid dehydrogenase [Polaromonas sp.]MDP2448388.1 2-hydroxyacid dehydrogenase [Polaromonas sp.]MDP3756587.1 2-hydroxyacid dehydrogenase [Polaromonas sp.]MDP3828608.1 2-hydroxyacid dehydrogenase [Polaromonas sp.]
MRVAVFSTRPYDRQFLDLANREQRHTLTYLEQRLDASTASSAEGSNAVCAFVNDRLDAQVLEALHRLGVQLVVLRSAGFNHVDLAAAAGLGIAVGRVPEYSPHAVAEHTAALVLTLNRKIHRAYARVREGNFALDGLLGFDLHGRTVGVIGTGKIGACFAGIMAGFGCRLLAFDPHPNPACVASGVRYVGLPELLAQSDIVSLHCPLTPATRHLIDAAALAAMKPGAMLINTSRGAVVDTRAVIAALKTGTLGNLGLDVYEEEADLFFRDLSADVLHDDIFARLLTFPNVVVTGHQAFFTEDALAAIASTTMDNLDAFEREGRPAHPVSVERLA